MDANPYESPQVEHPLERSQLFKRGVGLAAILLLTPPAMIIAVFTCCSVGRWFPGGPQLLLVYFGIPFAILVGLMAWAAYESRPRKDDPDRPTPPIGVFVATP